MSISHKKKILFILGYSTPLGGAQRSLHATISSFDNSIDSLIIVPDKGEVYELFENQNIQIVYPGYNLNLYGKVAKGWSLAKKFRVFILEYISYTYRLRNIIKAYGPNVIHFNNTRSFLLSFLATRALFSVKKIIHFRGRFSSKNKWAYFAQKYCDYIITVSQNIAKKCVLPKFRHKTHAIYNGVDPDKISSRANLKLGDNGQLVIGIFSNVVPFKGYHILVEALRLVSLKNYNNKIRVISLGKKPKFESAYINHVEGLISKYELEAIIEFCGFKKNPFPYYNSVDIVVLPSLDFSSIDIKGRNIKIVGNEGLPRVLLEAMSFGKPLIASDISGVREIIEDNVNGYIIDPDNPLQLAEKLIYLYENRRLIDKMGQESLSIFNNKFHIDRHNKQFMNLISSI